MSKKSKYIIGGTLLFSFLLLLLLLVTPQKQKKTTLPKDKIIKMEDNNYDAKIYEELEIPDNDDSEVLKEVFAEDIANSHTIEFFRLLLNKFSYPDNEEKWQKITEYLTSNLGKEKGEEMLELYKQYLEYENKLRENISDWKMPNDPQGMISYLKELQDFRRKELGKETADKLYGDEVKLQEYKVRRNSILKDEMLYANEKRSQLDNLNNEMWEGNENPIDNSNLLTPYDQYNNDLYLYQKNLSEMSSSERKNKIRELRKIYYSPETIQRLEKVDQELAKENEQRISYITQKQKIVNNDNLTEDEKNKKISMLRNEIYGKDAIYIERQENMLNKKAE